MAKKTRLIIDFRGKKLNSLEANLYIAGLRLGILSSKLSKAEERSYENWKERREEINERTRNLTKKGIYRNLSKNFYLGELLGKKMNSAKRNKELKYRVEQDYQEQRDSA